MLRLRHRSQYSLTSETDPTHQPHGRGRSPCHRRRQTSCFNTQERTGQGVPVQTPEGVRPRYAADHPNLHALELAAAPPSCDVSQRAGRLFGAGFAVTRIRGLQEQ